jgi:hypothetical protein
LAKPEGASGSGEANKKTESISRDKLMQSFIVASGGLGRKRTPNLSKSQVKKIAKV